jgi:hypothetical protein
MCLRHQNLALCFLNRRAVANISRSFGCTFAGDVPVSYVFKVQQ